MAATLAFGPFRLETDVGMLFRGADAIPLGQRAVSLLKLLLDSDGKPVGKSALIAAAWPDQAIEDSNLTVQIAAIRRALAGDAGEEIWIETLPRRGYRYIGPTVSRASIVDANPPLPEKPSIAVLPFTNLGADQSEDYFIDGIVDEIITGMSRISWLFVIARNSTLIYRGRSVDVRQIGRELGVHYVMEGTVRRQGDALRVTCQLIDASTGAHVWAERYERASSDIFALQDDIAQSVVGAIAPSMRRAEFDRVKRKRPDSLGAYDLTLRAQPDVDSGMPVRVTAALTLLEHALELEPDYALAHANAAMCHHCLYLRGGLLEHHRVESVRYARSALLYGQDDAAALTLAGFSLGMDGHDLDAAFTALDAALAISPSSALTHILGAVLFGWAGKAEQAIAWSERGIRLSPFDPWTFAAYDAQAMSHFVHGRYEDACRAAHRSVQANPAHSITYVQLAAALAKLGRLDEAKAAAARVVELQPTFRYGRQFEGVNCAPALAGPLGEALRLAGLPE